MHLFCKFYKGQLDRVSDLPQATGEQREKAEIGAGNNDFYILMSGWSNKWGCIPSFAITFQKDSVFLIRFILLRRMNCGIFHWKNPAFPQWKCFSWTVFYFVQNIFKGVAVWLLHVLFFLYGMHFLVLFFLQHSMFCF